ncbi:hypothetical protein P5673_011953 [Acropora cervicornis]|uniref:Uncharacterized protein n=1 Tax=Acropora cervicornis TaxID=6130 RepID=A0AAD9QNC1_ACRCE|nr:hypothetical protein P5673_011953 [Acropora cervicornis]
MDNSTKRLFEVVIDDLDEVLSQAVDKHEREEAFSNDGLDEILSQSLDIFEEYVRSENDYPRYKLSDANESLLVEEKNFALMKSKYCSAVDHHMSSSRLDLQYEACYNRIANKYFPIGYPTVLHCHWLQEQSDSPREDNDL